MGGGRGGGRGRGSRITRVGGDGRGVERGHVGMSG